MVRRSRLQSAGAALKPAGGERSGDGNMDEPLSVGTLAGAVEPRGAPRGIDQRRQRGSPRARSARRICRAAAAQLMLPDRAAWCIKSYLQNSRRSMASVPVTCRSWP